MEVINHAFLCFIIVSRTKVYIYYPVVNLVLKNNKL